MSQENIERLRAVYAEWAKGNFRAGGDLFATSITFEPGAPDQRGALGSDAFEVYWRGFLDQWAKFWTEAERFDEFGDTILVTERQHGIGKGSGVETDQTFYATWTFRDGRVVRVRWDTDRPQALEAAGLSE